jgi:hypothetical protein
MLSELVTPEVLQPTPLKKNLVPRFGTRDKNGENRLYFTGLGYMKDYNAQDTKEQRCTTTTRANTSNYLIKQTR